MKNFTTLIISGFFVLIGCLSSYSQTGGQHVYEFLRLSNSSRQAALGGNYLTVDDDDISLVLANPTLITNDISKNLVINYVDYFSDVNFGFVTYAHNFSKLGTFAASMQYVNYGTFTEADETGQTYGEFTAGDYALTIGWARHLHPNIRIGANIKGIYSDMHLFNSTGIAADFGAGWFLPDKHFATSLMVRNVGRQVKAYVPGSIEPLPFEIQFGVHKRLEHVPLGFHLLLHNLQKWDLTYNDPNAQIEVDPFTGELIQPSAVEDIANKMMHHVIVGMELSPSKNLSFRLGYNYHRRKEMIVESRLSTVGISWGFGIKISKFKLSYARSAYHLAGSPNVITITTNLSDFFDSAD
jgi:hypothetical protein